MFLHVQLCVRAFSLELSSYIIPNYIPPNNIIPHIYNALVVYVIILTLKQPVKVANQNTAEAGNYRGGLLWVFGFFNIYGLRITY